MQRLDDRPAVHLGRAGNFGTPGDVPVRLMWCGSVAMVLGSRARVKRSDLHVPTKETRGAPTTALISEGQHARRNADQGQLMLIGTWCLSLSKTEHH